MGVGKSKHQCQHLHDPTSVTLLVDESAVSSRDVPAPMLQSYLEDKVRYDCVGDEDCIVLGPVRIKRDECAIGRGSTSVVMRGTMDNGVQVAVKFIPRGNVADLTRVDCEVHAHVLLGHHDGIVPLYAVLEVFGPSFGPRGAIALVLGFADGGTLTADTVTNWAHPVMEAMRYAHERGVCHRDLCPENIFIMNGKVVIGDWGHSAVFSDGWDLFNQVVGRPQHCSPEQMLNLPYSGTLLDVWSFGVTLCRIYGGFVPFTSSSDLSTLTYTLPPSMPSNITEIVEKCLVISDDRPTFDELFMM